ncbi:MAG: hypothetical protein H0U76_23770 [Ktedonobacteraceae bacterium]|nr:hypothetical protein [Ktedonobacteraceae bacterium]
MATSIHTTTAGNASGARSFIGHLGFDRLLSILSCWFLGGLFVDGWAHSHGKVDNTFFTPWHAVLYSGYFSMAAVLIVVVWLNHRHGYSWLRSIPRGYMLSLFGVPLFTVAGAGDLVWHTLFGFEVGIEPLLSPTHLLLAFSAALMITGPVRAVWGRADKNDGWRGLQPAIFSLVAFLALLTFFTSFAHPIVDASSVTNFISNDLKSRTVAGLLLQTTLLMGVILVAVRRWQLPVGSMTVLIAPNAALMTVFSDSYLLIPGALAAGIIADVLLWRLRPSVKRIDALRTFAIAVPIVYYTFYFATLGITYGITWSIHLWMGAIVMSGVVGLLLSYVLVAPQLPVDADEGS